MWCGSWLRSPPFRSLCVYARASSHVWLCSSGSAIAGPRRVTRRLVWCPAQASFHVFLLPALCIIIICMQTFFLMPRTAPTVSRRDARGVRGPVGAGRLPRPAAERTQESGPFCAALPLVPVQVPVASRALTVRLSPFCVRFTVPPAPPREDARATRTVHLRLRGHMLCERTSDF